MSPSSQDKFSLRLAHLAFHLLKILKMGSPVSTILIHERESHNDLLKDFGLSEWNEAMEELLNFAPKPLARAVSPGWFAVTDYGKEKASADVLSELIQLQYRASKRPVEVASKWQFRIDVASYMLILSFTLYFVTQAIYLPPGGGLLTFEPWPARLAALAVVLFFVLMIAFSRQLNRHWFSNEQFIASAFYDAYLCYRKFIKDSRADTSLRQARKLVRKAAERMQRAGRRPSWDILAEDLERISKIGGEVDGLLLQAMPNHARSADIGELLIVLARCFLERTRNSMKMAKSLLAEVSPTESLALSLWSRLSSFGPSHPRIAGCVGGLAAACFVLLAYGAYAYLVSHEAIVPGASTFASAAGGALSVGITVFVLCRASR